MLPVSPHRLQSNGSTMTKTRRPTLRQIRELVAFLPQLYTEGFTPIKRWHTHNENGTLCFPWPEYDELVDKFFEAASSEWWVDHDYDRMPRKQCNLPVKVRCGELTVHPASEDPVLRGDSQG